jgi:DNA repair photolyase
MPLKKTTGQMYPWVTHMHTHLGGECQHKCSYCYVNSPRFGRPPRYTGDIRLIEDEFKVNYGGEPKTIFMEHANDIFGPGVTREMVDRIMAHCSMWPQNTYVFQSKNPWAFMDVRNFPPKIILGTTIESNRWYPNIMGADTPHPFVRAEAMQAILDCGGIPRFCTLEPILDFDVEKLADLVAMVKPTFLNLGADSKGHKLPEPPLWKIHALVDALKLKGIELREKHNLERLRKETP